MNTYIPFQVFDAIVTDAFAKEFYFCKVIGFMLICDSFVNIPEGQQSLLDTYVVTPRHL